jgi:undecaprenyl-diphosphatase
MNSLDAIILGVVEGLTEFLPVSSTGHLILTSHLLGLTGQPVVETFEIFIQLGAILAIVVLYRERFLELFKPTTRGGFSGRKGWMLLAATTFPPALLGFLTHKLIKTYLFGPMTVLWALAVGGLLLIAIERLNLRTKTSQIDQLTLKQAFSIGCFQCLALWPGMSRSGSTIIGGMLFGLTRSVAAEYSFIAAVPLMLMATVYDLVKSLDELNASDMVNFGIGFVVAFLSAIAAVVFFVKLLQRVNLAPFGIYRILLAVVFYLFLMR